MSHIETPSSLQAAENAIKRHEGFMNTMEVNEEKIMSVVDTGLHLVNTGNANADKIQEKVDSIQAR